MPAIPSQLFLNFEALALVEKPDAIITNLKTIDYGLVLTPNWYISGIVEAGK